jgi:hypothetical protein
MAEATFTGPTPRRRWPRRVRRARRARLERAAQHALRVWAKQRAAARSRDPWNTARKPNWFAASTPDDVAYIRSMVEQLGLPVPVAVQRELEP